MIQGRAWYLGYEGVGLGVTALGFRVQGLAFRAAFV